MTLVHSRHQAGRLEVQLVAVLNNRGIHEAAESLCLGDIRLHTHSHALSGLPVPLSNAAEENMPMSDQ
jgi:hypothetical protein